jgi:hypothetical protein
VCPARASDAPEPSPTGGADALRRAAPTHLTASNHLHTTAAPRARSTRKGRVDAGRRSRRLENTAIDRGRRWRGKQAPWTILIDGGRRRRQHQRRRAHDGSRRLSTQEHPLFTGGERRRYTEPWANYGRRRMSAADGLGDVTARPDLRELVGTAFRFSSSTLARRSSGRGMTLWNQNVRSNRGDQFWDADIESQSSRHVL